jgi:hypothetical protein
VFSAVPCLTTTTFRQFIENLGETEMKNFDNKGSELLEILTQIYNEKWEADKTLQWYFARLLCTHNSNKRFIQAFSIVTDMVGTFMGAFNAFEIQQPKSKFQDMSQGHNMLICVTQQHNTDIHDMKESLKSIVEVIDCMAKYNPGLLQLQISEQLDMFENRVTIITNAL